MEKILVSLILLSPFLGFVINGLRWNSAKNCVSGMIASTAILISFVCACLLPFVSGLLKNPVLVHYFDWISVGDFTSRAQFLLDPISLIMVLVITGVGFLIHVFSIGYMSEDKRPAKYFSYLNLFIFNMLLLVLGDNLLLMFVGWEGVGLCSYLLIGFWFSDSEKARAGLKAFITNRVGDAGFLLGIFTLFYAFGTIDFLELAKNIPQTIESSWKEPITLSCLFLFIGAVGKSAQIPLHVWLPDAMAGPTPVSALIHAATMVTAGIYMILRLDFIFMSSPLAMGVIAITGALTALMAATIGMSQWDIKKILAYSTISQLGFMFLAVGVGAFTSGLFHLITHAFFKALMFLGAGSVIHSLKGEQDIRKMGGLKKSMPTTYWTFLVGFLAIIGIFPFSGFFSKDEILWKVFASERGHIGLWIIGFVSAALTAFYMTRLMTLVFWSGSRVSSRVTPHESPTSMTLPLIVLSLLALFGGFIGLPHIFPGHPPHALSNLLKNTVTESPLAITSEIIEWVLMVASFCVAIVTSFFTYRRYKSYGTSSSKPKRLALLYQLSSNKYYFDENYKKLIVTPLLQVSESLWKQVDNLFIDGIPHKLSEVAVFLNKIIKRLQNGKIERYLVYVVFSMVIFISAIFIS